MNNKIEELTLEDIGELTDFLFPQYANTYPNDRGITREMFDNEIFYDHLKDYLRGRLSENHVHLFCLKVENKIIGTIGIEFVEELTEIWGFYVDLENQKQGIGTKLWNYLMKLEVLNDVKKIKLVVAKDSRDAISFYESRGFKIVNEEVWFWPSWIDEKIQNQYWVMEILTF